MHQLKVFILGPEPFLYTLNELKPHLKFNSVNEIRNSDVILFHEDALNDKKNHKILSKGNSLKVLANEENVYIKLSEFGIKNQDWNFEENREIILDVIDIFSPSRCMFASNFPVSSLKISFNDLYNNYYKIVKNFTSSEKKDLFYNTALKVYKLDLKIEE